MDGLRLYGLDAAGEAVFTEEVPALERQHLRRLAEQRLGDWHSVEVWQGPLCVIRLSRRAVPTA